MRRPDRHPTAEASQAFAEQVRARAIGKAVTTWSLGGSGILLASTEGRIVIDPYLTNRLGDAEPDAPPGWRDRSTPAPVLPEDLVDLDAVLVTHGHGDHFDPDTLAPLLRANPHAALVLPAALASRAAELGLPPGVQVVHPIDGQRLRLGPWEVEAVPAAHTPQHAPRPNADGAGGFDEVGYLVSSFGVCVYHAGDTIVHDLLLERLEGLGRRIDAAVLPINGRRWAPFQPHRTGNLSDEEAADLCTLLGIPILIPVHHELIGSSRHVLAPVVDYVHRVHPQLIVRDLKPGDATVLWRRPHEAGSGGGAM